MDEAILWDRSNEKGTTLAKSIMTVEINRRTSHQVIKDSQMTE